MKKVFHGIVSDCRECPNMVSRQGFPKCLALEKWLEIGTYNQPIMHKRCPLPDAEAELGGKSVRPVAAVEESEMPFKCADTI